MQCGTAPTRYELDGAHINFLLIQVNVPSLLVELHKWCTGAVTGKGIDNLDGMEIETTPEFR